MSSLDLVSVEKPVSWPFHSQPFVSCRLDCHRTCPYDTQETESAMEHRWFHANLSDWRSLTMTNAVGIDVSKGKSTVSVLQPGGTVFKKPFDVLHSSSALNELSWFIQHLDGETRVVMECIGRYHQPILHSLHDAGICAVNPHLIKNFGNNTIRNVKSDPADSRKISRYALDNWASLRQYPTMDTTRTQLKILNSQMDFFTKQKAAARTNLISLLGYDISRCELIIFQPCT